MKWYCQIWRTRFLIGWYPELCILRIGNRILIAYGSLRLIVVGVCWHITYKGKAIMMGRLQL